jgi:hypothetical protein
VDYSYVDWVKTGATTDYGVPYVSEDGSVISVGDLANQAILTSRDYGRTWTSVSIKLNHAFPSEYPGRAYKIVGCNNGGILVAMLRGDSYGYLGQLKVSFDQGATWENITTNGMFDLAWWWDIQMTDVGDLIGTALYTPAGLSWFTRVFKFVFDGNPYSNPYYTGGITGHMYEISDGVVYSKTPRLAITSTADAIVVTCTSGLHRSLDSGANWTQLSNVKFDGVVMARDGGEGTLYITGSYCQRTTNFKKTPVPTFVARVVTPSNAVRTMVLSPNGSIYYVASTSGQLWKSIDYGANYTLMTTITTFGNLGCTYDGSFVFGLGGDYSSDRQLYCHGQVLLDMDALLFTNATLDPGEIVTLEYLTNSTDLLPTLYPSN